METLVPGIKHAPTVATWAGHRPQRAEIVVRVERRAAATAGGPPKVLGHNYGHGGSGLTLWYGCVLNLVELLDQELR